MLRVKKIRPNNLLSGQIAKLLNVGDKKIRLTKKNRIFLFLPTTRIVVKTP